MRINMTLIVLVGLLAIANGMGCGSSTSNSVQPIQDSAELPLLTLEQWKSLPVEEKYDLATLDRLRQADKSLRPDRAWQKFMKEIVLPERMKDIPGVPGQQ